MKETEIITQPEASVSVSLVNAGILIEHLQQVQRVLKQVAVEGEDYMRLPGTSKDTMLQPLGEKLALAAGLATEPQVQLEVLPNGHREYRVSGSLVDPQGAIRGSGFGFCSTMESKYRYRYLSAPCPECGMEGTIMRSKYPPRGAPPGTSPGWYCNAKKDGCGASFPLEAGEFKTTREENPDLADQYNTVMQMAIKRWLVSTVKRTLALSGMFTMDLEEMMPAETRPAETAKASKRRELNEIEPRQKPEPRRNAGPPEPPVDAYEAAATEATRQAASVILSPAETRRLKAAAKAAGVRMTLAMASAGWDGTLTQLPQGMVKHVEKAISDLAKEQST